MSVENIVFAVQHDILNCYKTKCICLITLKNWISIDDEKFRKLRADCRAIYLNKYQHNYSQISLYQHMIRVVCTSDGLMLVFVSPQSGQTKCNDGQISLYAQKCINTSD